MLSGLFLVRSAYEGTHTYIHMHSSRVHWAAPDSSNIILHIEYQKNNAPFILNHQLSVINSCLLWHVACFRDVDNKVFFFFRVKFDDDLLCLSLISYPMGFFLCIGSCQLFSSFRMLWLVEETKDHTLKWVLPLIFSKNSSRNLPTWCHLWEFQISYSGKTKWFYF